MGLRDMPPTERRAYVRAMRVAQGLPATIEDEGGIERLSAILRATGFAEVQERLAERRAAEARRDRSKEVPFRQNSEP